MAIPWLIGGAVVAVAAYALSGDDDSSSSSSSNKADKEKEAKQKELTAYAEQKVAAIAKRCEVEDIDTLNSLIFTPKSNSDNATYLASLGRSIAGFGNIYSVMTQGEQFDDMVEKCWQSSKKEALLAEQVNVHELQINELLQAKETLRGLLDE